MDSRDWHVRGEFIDIIHVIVTHTIESLREFKCNAKLVVGNDHSMDEKQLLRHRPKLAYRHPREVAFSISSRVWESAGDAHYSALGTCNSSDSVAGNVNFAEGYPTILKSAFEEG